LAYHYDRAGVADKAAVWLFESGRRARRSYLNQEAAERFERARSWLDGVPPDEAAGEDWDRLAVELHEELGDALRALARHGEARSSYRAALERAGSTSWRLRARLERKVGITLGSEARLPAALEAYAGAERLLEHDPIRDDAWWTEWLDAGIEEMWIHYQAGDWEEMQFVAGRLQPAAEHHGSLAQKVSLQRTLGAIALRRDRYVVGEEAMAHAQAAVTAADLSGDDVLRGSAWFSLGFSQLWYGDLRAAEASLALALELSRRTGDVSTETACHAYLALAARLRGDVELVHERATLAQQKATATGAHGYVASSQANLAWVALRQGAPEQAGRMAREALETWEGSGISHAFQWQGIWPLLKLAVDRSDAPEARTLAKRLLGADQQPPPSELETRLREASDDRVSDDVVLGAVQRALPIAVERGFV
jgi:tetratricopeptide (TPR) repeat protein